MEQGNKKIVFIAIILALITAGLIFSYLKQIENASKNIEYVTISVAAKNIDAKTAIAASDLKEVKIVKSSVNKNALLNKAEIINKITKEPIYEGEQILSTRLADNLNSTMAYRIPQGKRAITINVNEASAVGYFIQPGDFVDVIVTLQQEVQEQRDKQLISPRMSKTLLQNVMLLGIGKEMDPAEKGAQGAEKKEATAKEAVKTVTLAVSQEDAERVAIAEEAGILKLTLRPVGDQSRIESYGVTRESLVPQETKIVVSK